MYRFGSSRNTPVEYYILANVSAAGPVVGYLADKPIAEAVTDHSGNRYHYVGLASRERGGRFDVGALRSGEWIVEPGLVYASERGVAS